MTRSITDSIKEAAAKAATIRTRKDDLTGGDLAAGGLKAPEQANTRRAAFRGIPVEVDRPKGYVQEGVGADGTPWRRVYHVDYGHVPNTLGGDGQGLDVFLGGDEAAPDAHWVLQRKADGSFDEYKVMLGFNDRETAKAIYLAHVPKRFFGSMCSMGVEMMKALLGIEPVDSIAKAEGLVRDILESASGLGVLGGDAAAGPTVQKPFAGFPDFDSCVIAMQADGNDEESARRICGSLQADAEKRSGVTSAIRKGKSTAALLVEAGPPDEWSGGVHAALGERAPDVERLWGALDEQAKQVVRSAWEKMFDAVDVILELEDAMPEVAKIAKRHDIKIAKAEQVGEMRYVLGVVLEPDVVDAQGDTYSVDEVRKAAWQYMRDFQNLGLMHKGLINGRAILVESWVEKEDRTIDGTAIKAGTWLIGAYIPDDDVWGQIKSDGLTGWSIGGFATKTKLE